jgi:kojibiose phosphorylase
MAVLMPGLSRAEWLVEEKKWGPKKQAVTESMFTLGNGYLGSRGVPEELPEGCTPGTYFAGLYDCKNTQVTEMVNAPNPVVFKMKADGEELSLSAMKAQSHYRALDMKQGLLSRSTVLVAKNGNRYRIESVRFFHIERKHIAAIRVCITPLDAAAGIEVSTFVDDSVTNKGIMTEGDKMHFITKEKRQIGDINYLSDMTFEHRYTLAYATLLRVKKGASERPEAAETFSVKPNKGETVCFTKLTAINSTRDNGVTDKNIRSKTLKLLKSVADMGFEALLVEHCQGWADRWAVSDIQVDCGGEPQRALRFNVYHLLILANPQDGQASIGARVLSAEDYKGHVFWDTELFMLPFFIYSDPAAAKALLMYRYNRLDPARGIARRRGYGGTQFPWESADKGVEVTPRFTVDLDGRIVRTIIGEEEHIVCDVGYAVWHYYFATGDRKFMLGNGLEVLLETARFWVSRVKLNKQKKCYEIHGVMGCDEFHANTNNNAFTNGMARFNILAALACLEELDERSGNRVDDILERIGLKRKAIGKWRKVAVNIKRPPKRKDLVLEEFDGFYKMKYFPLPKREKYYLPGLPEKHVSVKDLCTTQFVKQGDTLILLYLLGEEFDFATKKANYEFYDARTLHKSSLSPSTYAIMGAEIGDMTKAYNYFLACLYTDIHNLYNNTARGIHGASLGATWQVAVNGFCGMRVYFDKLAFDPHVPRQLKGIRFAIKWRGYTLRVAATKTSITLAYEAPGSRSAMVHVGGQKVVVKGGMEEALSRKGGNAWQANR